MEHKLYDIVNEINKIGDENGFFLWIDVSIECPSNTTAVSKSGNARHDKIRISILHSKTKVAYSPDLLISMLSENNSLERCMDCMYRNFLNYIMFAKDSEFRNARGFPMASFSSETLFSKDMSKYDAIKRNAKQYADEV